MEPRQVCCLPKSRLHCLVLLLEGLFHQDGAMGEQSAHVVHAECAIRFVMGSNAAVLTSPGNEFIAPGTHVRWTNALASSAWAESMPLLLY